jgi:hypothetical protein
MTVELQLILDWLHAHRGEFIRTITTIYDIPPEDEARLDLDYIAWLTPRRRPWPDVKLGEPVARFAAVREGLEIHPVVLADGRVLEATDSALGLEYHWGSEWLFVINRKAVAA